MDTVWKDKFYMAFRLCPFIMTIHSFPDMGVLDVNDAYERSTGLRRDEVVGRTMFEIGLWTDNDALTRAIEKLKKERKIYNLEVHFRNKAGQDRNGLASSELFDGPDGQRVLSIVEDISIRKRAEDSLRVSESKFRENLAGTVGGDFAYVRTNIAGQTERERCLSNSWKSCKYDEPWCHSGNVNRIRQRRPISWVFHNGL